MPQLAIGWIITPRPRRGPYLVPEPGGSADRDMAVADPLLRGLALAVAADPQGAGWFDLWIALGCALGAFVMRGAGCTWNDYTDREFDAQAARTRSRPLPWGR